MIAGLVLALSSCKNLYVQKSVFVPLLKEKGELKADVNLGREAISANAAYAFSPKFSGMLGGFSTIDNSGQYKRNYNYQAEAAIGYYKVFRDSIHFESYLGASKGIFDNEYERVTNDLSKVDLDDAVFKTYFGPLFLFLLAIPRTEMVNATGSYQSAFFQNSISYLGPKSSSTFTARLQYIQFNNYREEGTFNGNRVWYYINIPPKIFLQPVITNKIKLAGNLNTVIQFGYNISLFEGAGHYDAFQWNNVFYSVGIEMAFQTQKKK